MFNINEKKALILDLDGTIFLGDKQIVPAVQWLKDNASRFDYYYLTNNTSKTPDEYLRKLEKVGGIKTTAEYIITPLFALSDYINLKGFTSVYLLANASVTAHMRATHPNVDFEYDREKNQAVAMTYDTEITFDKFKNACWLLENNGVEYLATHPDKVCPYPEGDLPDVGSFIELVKATSGRVPNIIFGKPNAGLISNLLTKYGASALAVAGDRLYTDKELADNAGVDFICVLSGETTRGDIDNRRYREKDKPPAVVLENLGDLGVGI
ncbi:MAG: HAD hydrolase-like protein [Oscillospiraceae bacterium]|nr:HAD hydrolase-like protein [Oscillospiraceae bacterium]